MALKQKTYIPLLLNWIIASVGLGLTTNLAFGAVQDKRKLTVAYIEFPPISYTDEFGKPQGTLVNLIRDVLTEANYDWDVRSYPSKRMAQYLKEGRVDMWMGIANQDHLKDHILFSEKPVTSIILRAYSSDSTIPHIRSREDLNGKRLILMRGYSYGGLIHYIKNAKNNISIFEADEHHQAIRALLSNRGDYLLDYKGPIDDVISQSQLPDLRFTTLAEIGVHFIISKKTENAEHVLNQLENAFNRVNANQVQ